MLELRNIAKSFNGKAAVDGLSLTVTDGEYLSMLGPSGAGKTTLLRLIAGFEQPDSGQIILDGRRIDGVPAHDRGIGFVSQGFALFPHLSVFDNVVFGLRHRTHDRVTDRAEQTRRVAAILDMVGLRNLASRSVQQLSGGQKQRVALARSLVVHPRVCLLDEPLGALDANLRQRMTAELARIHQTLGITFIHVTGNEMEALAMGDRVVVLHQGRALQVADPDTVYNRPAGIGVARFLNRYNIWHGTIDGAGGLACAAGRLDLPAAQAGSAGSGSAGYCIRFDRIGVRPADAPLPPGDTGLPAAFVAEEYAGSTMTCFFRLQDGSIAEVEYALSHRRPDHFTAGDRVQLSWRRDDGLVFAGDAA